MILTAGLLRQAADRFGPDLHGYDLEAMRTVSMVPSPIPSEHLVVALGLAGVVTILRFSLMANNEPFCEETDASLTPVLSNLNSLDLLWVAGLPAVAEEVLFRGALIPAVSPDWKGAVVAGVVFGVLHANGGRGAVSSMWAGGVGISYGIACVMTQDLAVPVVAHFAANLTSAVAWK